MPCCSGFSLQVKYQQHRRRHRVSSFRSVKDITEEDLGNVAITVRDKVYDKVLVGDLFRLFPGAQHTIHRQQQASAYPSSSCRLALSCVGKDRLPSIVVLLKDEGSLGYESWLRNMCVYVLYVNYF